MRVGIRTGVMLALLATALCPLTFGDTSKPTAPPAPAPVPTPTKYPDQAYLSNYRYANGYFGFTIDLPADAALRPIPIPNPVDGGIPLLETLGHLPERGTLSLTAYPAGENHLDARGLLRRMLDNELAIGVEELHGLTKTSIGGQPFIWFETRRGLDQHAVYATQVNGHVLRIVVSARDPKMLQQLQTAVQRMRFFPPASIAEYAGVGAIPYSGPAIPYHKLEELKANPPGKAIDSGKLTGNVYENRQIGFAYELPKGWHIRPDAAVMPAIERGRALATGQPAIGPNEKFLRDACERTLVSSWRRMPDSGGDISYDEFGEVTIFATPLSCFPNATFPDDLTAKEPLRDFLVAYGESHPIVRDMKGARAFTHDGRTFLVMDGTVAYKEAGDALSRRVSVALALTRQHDYLLAFFFAAPHETELRELANAKVLFEPEPPQVKQAKAPDGTSAEAEHHTQPGGAAEPSAATPPPAAPSANASAAESKPTEATPTAAESPTPLDSADAPAQPAPFRPSLLKPGETMEQQQMKGTPVPKK